LIYEISGQSMEALNEYRSALGLDRYFYDALIAASRVERIMSIGGDVETASTSQIQPLPEPSEHQEPARLVVPAARAAEIDPLYLHTSTRIQKRLISLGYFTGSADGTWGPQSRAAFARFKLANRLSFDDAVDGETNRLLMSPTAVASPRPTTSPAEDFVHAKYGPSVGSTLHPLNEEDAIRINSKLRSVGLFKGRSDSLWSVASRNALRAFKLQRGLANDDVWDATVESVLFRGSEEEVTGSTDFMTSIGGTWAANSNGCPKVASASEYYPLVIGSNRATAGPRSCEFKSVSQNGTDWNIKALCNQGSEHWNSNVRLSRNGTLLMWSSERGTANYVRCE
jgi:peptidoglycan hydrolase-like protein with peptidoglycan-binding domain